MCIGHKLKYYRKSNSLSQIELSKKTGVAQTTISDLEKNKYNPRIDVLCKLTKALGIEISDLIN